MRTKEYLLAVFGSLLALSLIFHSCTSTKITAVSCPEYSKGRYNKVADDHNRKKNKTLTARHTDGVEIRHAGLSGNKHLRQTHAPKGSDFKEIDRIDAAEKIAYIDRSGYSESLTASSDNYFVPVHRNSNEVSSPVPMELGERSDDLTNGLQTGCDTIVLKSGSRIVARVEEIGQSEIRYRRCDNLNGPMISMAKTSVNRILYVNGTHEVMVSENPIVVNNYDVKPQYNPAPLKTEPLAIAGFIAAIVGLFIGGIPLGTLAVIFGILSLGKLRRYPARFKGRKLAIASIIIGFIAVIGAIYFLSIM